MLLISVVRVMVAEVVTLESIGALHNDAGGLLTDMCINILGQLVHITCFLCLLELDRKAFALVF